jgi:hypothetical protein
MGKPYVETNPVPAAPAVPSPEIQQLQHEQRFADATGGGESRILRGRDALINQAVNQGKDLVDSPEFKAWKKGGKKGKLPTATKPPPPPADDWAPPSGPSPSFEDWSKAMARMNDQANMTWDLEDVLGALKGGK